MEGLSASRRAAPKGSHSLPNTCLGFIYGGKSYPVPNPLSFELTGFRGKVNNSPGVSQNAEAAARGSCLSPIGASFLIFLGVFD